MFQHEGPIGVSQGADETRVCARRTLGRARVTSRRAALGRSVDSPVGAIVDSAIDSIRRLSFSLRPSLLDDLGLSAAIRENSSRLLQDANIDLEFRIEGDDKIVDSEISIVAFRISQEAISNILRHSDASHVKVCVTTDDESLCVDIQDDGAGFDVTTDRSLAEHFGLASMRERAALAGGKTAVESKPGGGTRVRVCLPLTREAALA